MHLGLFLVTNNTVSVYTQVHKQLVALRLRGHSNFDKNTLEIMDLGLV